MLVVKLGQRLNLLQAYCVNMSYARYAALICVTFIHDHMVKVCTFPLIVHIW